MKTRSLVVDVDEIKLTATRTGFEMVFQEYGDGKIKRRAVLKFNGGFWIGYIANKLWDYVKGRQRELDESTSALKGE